MKSKTKKKCIKCKENTKGDYDLCNTCFFDIEKTENSLPLKEHFNRELKTSRTHTVYIMFFGEDNCKVGYTNDLNSRMIEIKRKYPANKLVYLREFSKESEARRFEVWLKNLNERELNRIISLFQDKVNRLDMK
jgi:predicted GIY-YIG superfamily endonuclease